MTPRWRLTGALRREWEREEAAALVPGPPGERVTEAHLAGLPEPVRRYLRAVGAIGRPRVRSYRVRIRGRIRSAPDASWMPFQGEQLNLVDPPTRLFWMRARRMMVPIEVLHRLRDGRASMRVVAAGCITLARAEGPVLDRSEAVTLLNDMCVFAPASLLQDAVTWTPIDDRSARATFVHGDHSVSATLIVDDEGLLRDFHSDDRSRASADGRAFSRHRFSTPLRDYRQLGPVRVATRAEGRWHLPSGAFTYLELEVLGLDHDVDRST